MQNQLVFLVLSRGITAPVHFKDEYNYVYIICFVVTNTSCHYMSNIATKNLNFIQFFPLEFFGRNMNHNAAHLLYK